MGVGRAAVADVGVTSVLVTGAGGVIGHALVAALRADGAEVRTLTRTTGGDATDPAAVARAAEGVQTIFHLAPADPAAVLAAAPPAARVVLASSVLVYGAAPGPLREAQTTADLHDRAVVARLTNTYGPGDRRPERLVPTLLRAARDGVAPLLRSDGTPRRDFVHADDAARALIALAEHGAPGEAYNIGSGAATSVREVVAAFERALGRSLHAIYDGHGDGARWTDTTKIANATGWRARIGLEDGLRRLLAAEAAPAPG